MTIGSHGRAGANGHMASVAPGDEPVPTRPERPHQPRPVFVIGPQRSGASLVALALGQHPNLVRVPDVTWLEQFSIGVQATLDEDAARRDLSQLAALGITGDHFFAQLGAAIDQLMLGTPFPAVPAQPTSSPDGQPYVWRDFGNAPDRREAIGAAYRSHRWVECSYTHCFIVPTLRRLFPAARFIHVVRDARETVAALTDPANPAVYKSRHVQFTAPDAWEHWLDTTMACLDAERSLGPEAVLRIRWRDLVTTPQATLQRCLRFLDEPFDPACLRPLSPAPLVGRPASDEPEADDAFQELRRQADLLSFALLTGEPARRR